MFYIAGNDAFQEAINAYDQSANLDSLLEAIALAERFLPMAESDDWWCAIWLSNLACSLTLKYERLNDPNVLETATVAAVEAVARGSTSLQGHSDAALHGVVYTYRARYDYTEKDEDYQWLVAYTLLAVESTSPSSYGGVNAALSLVEARLQRFRLTKLADIEDLQAAFQTLENEVEIGPESEIHRSRFHTNLAKAFLLRYEVGRNNKDLDDAVHNAWKADEAMDGNHPRRFRTINNLADILWRRFRQSERVTDLDVVIRQTKRVLEIVPTTHVEYPNMVFNLAHQLESRFEFTEDEKDIDLGISVVQGVIETMPQNPLLRRRMLHILSRMLVLRYQRLGHSDLSRQLSLETKQKLAVIDPPGDNTDLDAVIDADRRETSIHLDRYSPRRNPWTARLANRGIMDLDRIDELRDNIASLRPDHPDKVHWQSSLASRLMHRYGKTRMEEDYYECLQLLKETLVGNALAITRRINTMWDIMDLLMHKEDFQGADQYAQDAVDLLPLACTLDTDRLDQQHIVAQTAGIVAEACQIALMNGKIEDALQRIEFGRGLIFGHLMDSQTDMSVLETQHPELAKTYKDLRAQVIEGGKSQSSISPQTNQTAGAKSSLCLLKECEETIRKEGFENFHLPPSLKELRDCAEEGPIVIVNATCYGSAAIIVLKDSISTLSLDGLVKGPILESFDSLLRRARTRATEPHRRDVEQESDTQYGSSFLVHLWETCVLPVLLAIQIHGNPQVENGFSRVWWIGTGEASSFPFHAAMADPALESNSTFDWVMSTYTPTIRALKHVRERRQRGITFENHKPSILVVPMPETPGQAVLYGVERERDTVESIVADSFSFTGLRNPTPEQVLQNLEHSELVHFACHGSSDVRDPSQSHLLLLDDSATTVKKLTVESILEANTEHGAWLAYLSACSTAQVKADKFAAENLHLAGAFQTAGFRHVIASLWPTDDDVCVEVARVFYSSLKDKIFVATDKDRAVAESLHEAVLAIRRQDAYKDPIFWAPFVHFGP
jgi:hypothetical protein